MGKKKFYGSDMPQRKTKHKATTQNTVRKAKNKQARKALKPPKKQIKRTAK